MKSKLKSPYVIFTICFIVIVSFWELIFLRYGKSHIFNIDGIEQYYAGFFYFGKYIRNSFFHVIREPFSFFSLPAFDLSIAMGEDIIGALNYYGFGSPLNLLAIFANNSTGPVLFTVAYYLRLYLGGLAFIYLSKTLNITGYSSAVGAICFVFSGFVLVGCSRYLEWGSVLVYLPLIICGAEKILKNKGGILFVLSICFAAMCGFYYLYMSSLCLAVYVLIRLSFIHRRINFVFLSNIIKLCGFYILGVFMSSLFFFPSVEAYFGSERSGATSMISILTDKELFHPDFDLLTGFYRVTERGEYSYGVWILYLLSLIGVWFFIRSNAAKQLIIACFVTLCCAIMPFSGWLFNGFGETNLRYVVIIHFCISVNVAFFLGTLQKKMADKVFLRRLVSASSILISVFTGIYSVSVFYSGFGYNWRTEFLSYEEVDSYVNTPPYNNSLVLSQDSDVFRISKEKGTGMHKRPENMAMLNGYYGMTYFLSIVNDNTQDYVNRCTGEDLNWRSFGVGDDSRLNSDCGVKYYMSLSPEAPDGFFLADKVFFNDDTWYIYENSLFKGFAYFSDPSGAAVDNISYDNFKNILTCEVESGDVSSTLTVAFPYHKNWIARIDNKKTSISKSPDAMFIDIDIPRGSHILTLYYKSTARTVGMIFSVIAILLMIVMYILTKDAGSEK